MNTAEDFAVQLRLLAPVSAALLLAACAHKPIIDTRGVNMAQYENDLYECRAYAEQVDMTRQAATGAAVGAVVGAAVGAAVGNSKTAEKTAGAFAVGGAAKGAGRAVREKHRVVNNCLRNRGYAVLN